MHVSTAPRKPTDLPQSILRMPFPKATATAKAAIGKADRSLTAAATRLVAKHNKKGARSGQSSWQQDAWDMYDQVGEQRFLATVLAGRLSQARLYVGEASDDALKEAPQETTNAKASALLDAIGDGISGRVQLLYRLSVNLFIAGEGWLVGIPPHLGDPTAAPPIDLSPDDVIAPGSPTIGPEEFDPRATPLTDYSWHMLSVDEVQTNGSGDTVTLKLGESPSEHIEADPEELYLIRIWRPHPRRAWEADSPTRSSLPVLRELVGLTMRIAAQIDSRLAGAGLLLVPAEAQRALQEAAAVTDDEDVLTEALMTAMMEPISDRSSASAVVPLVATVPGETIDQFRHMTFADDLDAAAQEMRAEAIRRLALGEDAPPELLLGTGGMNHWGAWLVQEDVVTTHLEPPLRLISEALTTHYLRPALMLDGMPEEEAERYVVWYDVSHLIIHPNRATQALSLHQEGVLSDQALAEASGFDEGDMPEAATVSDEERALEMVLSMVRDAPTLAVSPGLPALMGQILAVLRGDTATMPAGTDSPPTPPPPGNGAPAASPPGGTEQRPAEPAGPEVTPDA